MAHRYRILRRGYRPAPAVPAPADPTRVENPYGRLFSPNRSLEQLRPSRQQAPRPK